MERHTNYTTVNVTCAPKLNESRVDFYCYQLIDSLTHLLLLTSNTSHTEVELSIPYDVNMSLSFPLTTVRVGVHRLLFLLILVSHEHNVTVFKNFAKDTKTTS